jgi:hypothetical protein
MLAMLGNFSAIQVLVSKNIDVDVWWFIVWFEVVKLSQLCIWSMFDQ